MQVQPYLNFNGRCEEALEFYRDTLGATIEMLLRFKDSPQPPSADCAPADGNQVMHASLRIGDSVLGASDGQPGGTPGFSGFSLSLIVADADEAQRRLTALAAGGQVTVPLARTFFSPGFGMALDRFGISWMVLAMA